MRLVWVVIPLLLIGIVGVQESFAEETEFIDSPKQQIKTGILPSEVECKVGLKLIFKSTDNTPICVKEKTAEKLIQRGWAIILSDVPTIQMKEPLIEKEEQTFRTPQQPTNMSLTIPTNLDKYSAADYACNYNSITESTISSTVQTTVSCDAVRSKKLDSENHLVWCACGGSTSHPNSGLTGLLYMPENCWTVNSSNIEKQGFDICEANFPDPKYVPSRAFEGLTETYSNVVKNNPQTKIMIEKQETTQIYYETISKNTPLITESNVSEMYPFQIYEFDIKEHPEDIRSIDVRYKQWASSIVGDSSGADLYIWNIKNNEWVFVESVKPSGSHITFKNTFTNVDELIDENNVIHLLALASWGFMSSIVTEDVLVIIK